MPSAFNAERRSWLADLEKIIGEVNVQLRGWDYPHIPDEGISRSETYIEGTVSWAHYIELWRLYKSGQYVHLFAMEEDWFKDGGLAMLDFEPGTVLGLESVLYTMTEVFVFASRLADTFPLGPDVVVQVRLKGLANRQLISFNRPHFGFRSDRRANVNDFASESTLSSQELMAHHSEVAVEQSLKLFELFHWDPARQTVVEDQRRLLERRL